MDMDFPISIAAIGRVSNLGDLYDLRSEKFLPLSLFKKPLNNSMITTTGKSNTKLKYAFENTFKEKFDNFDISAELRVSILSGMLELEGSGKYFKDKKKIEKSTKVSLIQSFSTVVQSISFTDERIKELVDINMLTRLSNLATHVVAKIQWGGKVCISVEDTNFEDKEKQEIEGSLKLKINNIMNFISGSGSGSVGISQVDRKKMENFLFDIIGDIVPDEAPTSLFQAVNFMKETPKLVKEANEGKGKPIKYELLPISFLFKLMKIK